MKKRSGGFSIVEIMISMVILSIVMLVMSNVIIVSALEHSAAQGKDDGNFIARQKLNELQNPNTIPAAGTDNPTYKGVTYAREWTLTGSSPILAEVTVTWTKDGKTKSASAAGYIEAVNPCLSIATQHTPEKVKLYGLGNSEITTLVSTDTVVAAAHETTANSFICRIYGVDQDTSLGDYVRISFDGGTSDNDQFRLSNDTLYCKNDLSTPNQSFTVRVVGLDCRNDGGFSKSKQFKVKVGAPNTKPKTPNNQTFTMAENKALNYEVGTLAISPSESMTGLVWTGVTVPAQLTVSADGKIKCTSTAANHETANELTITAKLTRTASGEDSTITAKVTVTDVNEAASQVKLTSTSVSAAAAVGTTVGTLSVTDEDALAAAPTANWVDHLYSEITGQTGSSYFKVENGAVKVEAALTAGSYNFKVRASDVASQFSKDSVFTITVAAPNCRGYAFWSGTASYANNARAGHLNKLWKKIDWETTKLTPGSAPTQWQEIMSCSETTPCSTYPAWSSTTGYNTPGTIINRNSKFWENTSWNNTNHVPPNTSYWIDLGGCQ